jgi:hypothetical protein
MLRALVVAMLLGTAAAGCGDDESTMGPSSHDLSQPPLDLAQAGFVCGPSVCTGGSCVACASLFGGICATPCKTSMQSTCPSPTICRPATSGPDAGVSVQFAGSCAGFDGYCL